MAVSRLRLALESGEFHLPDAGTIGVFRPAGGTDLSVLPQGRVHIVHGFFPDVVHFERLGYRVSTEPEDGYAAAIVCLPRAKAMARQLIGRAAASTRDGLMIVDGQKTDGIESVLRHCRKAGAEVLGVMAKAHGKIALMRGGCLASWADEAAGFGAAGFLTAPGVFSADAPDRGSEILADALPASLSGRVADLGAGWGYLSAKVLERSDVEEMHLVEAEFDALECARGNIADPRARFHWDDARTFEREQPFDHVVTNPPFHLSRSADPSLGQAFIAAAARLLGRHGTLWLVANRHLPYEVALSSNFVDVAEIAGDSSFKVFRASRPARAARQRA